MDVVDQDPSVAALGPVGRRFGEPLRLVSRLAGGEQGGAWLVATSDGRELVLKLQPDGWKADRLIAAGPAVQHAVALGWPAAQWVSVGRLPDRTAYVLCERVAGTPITVLDPPAVRAVLATNSRQAGVGLSGAFDDNAQLIAVLTDHPWRTTVRDHGPAGARLVDHADAVLAVGGGPTELPLTDVVHGDYSSSNLIRDAAGDVRLVDCETVGRGTRVRDLADLYRQCFVHPGADPAAVDLLRFAGCRVAGPAVFRTCVLAVSLNNLAWYAENRPSEDFDRACRAVHALFDALD